MLTPLVVDDEAYERVEALSSAEGDIIELLRDLPTAQRDAITAHVLDERPYHEVAADLRCDGGDTPQAGRLRRAGV